MQKGAFDTLPASPFTRLRALLDDVTPPVWLVKSHIEAGTLELFEDQRGLRMRASLDMRDPDVRSIVPKMQRGDLDKMSFAFIPTRQKWKDVDGKDLPRRTIEEAELYDVSIVTTPAYSGTEIGLRSLEQFRNSQSWLFKRSTSTLKCAALT